MMNTSKDQIAWKLRDTLVPERFIECDHWDASE
jgi:hypothetical protein